MNIMKIWFDWWRSYSID